MKDQLKRILSLVRKTGDTMIVTDPEGKDAYVVMDLDQYELFLGFSGEQEDGFDPEIDEGMIPEDKVPTYPEEPEQVCEDDMPDVWGMMPPAGDDSETWDLNRLTDQERVDLEQQYRDFVAKNVQDAVEGAEQEGETQNTEKLQQNSDSEETKNKNIDEDDDFGEEQFYLEPIE